jgi:hypothetical protein
LKTSEFISKQRDISYHPTKHLLASASYDKTVGIWKL